MTSDAQCFDCKHLHEGKGRMVCDAFPEWIPSNSRPLERGSSLLAHFDTDSMRDHDRDVEKDLKYGWLKPEPA